MAVDLFDHADAALRYRVVATERTDGDVHPTRVPADQLSARQRAISGVHWTMAEQVHGRGVHVALADRCWPVADRADVVVARSASSGPVAVWAADCAPIVLFGRSGLTVAAHAGWRGLAAGVIDEACAAVAELGDDVVAAVVGPLIHPCCYEFAAPDIAQVAVGVHVDPVEITTVTSTGAVALDVPTSVRQALAANGVVVDVMGECTGCTDRWFSHRVRADAGRHAVVAWVEPNA